MLIIRLTVKAFLVVTLGIASGGGEIIGEVVCEWCE